MTGLSQTATVVWNNPAGTAITSTQDDYTIDVGTKDDAGAQDSILTIGTTKLAALTTPSTFTCVVTSGEYADSEASSNTMTLTKLTFAVEAKHREVEEDAAAVLSCVITGITKVLSAATWTDGSDGALTDGADYTIDAGTYDADTNSQTTTLTVTNGVSADSTFSCKVSSTEWTKVDEKTSVTLNVFGKFNIYCTVFCCFCLQHLLYALYLLYT